MPRRLSVPEYIDGIRQGIRSVRGRSTLARSISLVESKLPSDRQLATQLIENIMEHTGKAFRIGITGVPGVGKSTTIDNLAMLLIERGHTVAVLAIDPSSAVSGGSILGDKTRMHQVSVHPHAFVRPSPTDTYLGGVARKTRESILLCEASGCDIILVESVGVGQSEILLSSMVDCFVALMLPNAGDELQGIKKGLLEMVDIVAINKSDGENRLSAEKARKEYQTALHYTARKYAGWSVPVLLISGLYNTGMDALWEGIQTHHTQIQENGLLQKQRSQQQVEWLRTAMQDRLWEIFRENPELQEMWKEKAHNVENGIEHVGKAVDELVVQFMQSWSPSISPKVPR